MHRLLGRRRAILKLVFMNQEVCVANAQTMAVAFCLISKTLSSHFPLCLPATLSENPILRNLQKLLAGSQREFRFLILPFIQHLNSLIPKYLSYDIRCPYGKFSPLWTKYFSCTDILQSCLYSFQSMYYSYSLLCLAHPLPTIYDYASRLYSNALSPRNLSLSQLRVISFSKFLYPFFCVVFCFVNYVTNTCIISLQDAKTETISYILLPLP